MLALLGGATIVVVRRLRVNLRTGELWKEVFIAKMHPLHPIFN